MDYPEKSRNFRGYIGTTTQLPFPPSPVWEKEKEKGEERKGEQREGEEEGEGGEFVIQYKQIFSGKRSLFYSLLECKWMALVFTPLKYKHIFSVNLYLFTL